MSEQDEEAFWAKVRAMHAAEGVPMTPFEWASVNLYDATMTLDGTFTAGELRIMAACLAEVKPENDSA